MVAVNIIKYYDFNKKNVLRINFHNVNLQFSCDDQRWLEQIKDYFKYYPQDKTKKNKKAAHCIINIIKKEEYDTLNNVFKERKTFEAFPTVNVSVGTIKHYYYYKIGSSYFVIINNQNNDCACILFESKNRTMVSVDYLIHIIMIEWLRGMGLFIIHASGICNKDKAHLFIGPPGCGKTTCALLGVKHGYALLGDDQVIIKKERNKIMAYSSVRKIKMNLDMISKFRELRTIDINSNLLENKNEITFEIERYFNIKFNNKAEVARVYFITKTESKRKLERTEALPLLMNNSFFYSRKDTSLQHFDILCRLIAAVDAYQIDRRHINADFKTLVEAG